MLTEPEIADEDEEEHFYDVPETADGAVDGADASPAVKKFSTSYDAKKRDPEHAHADRSCLWDILPFLQHFHPSVALFAENLYLRKKMPPKPDPAQHSLMHFLDRFVYRNPRTKQGVTHGSSIMQPMGGSSAADLLFKAGNEISGAKAQAPVNAEAFWTKKVEDVPVDEVFFHSYFNAAGNSKKRAATTAKDAKKKRSGDDEDSEDEGEEEIWQAIANSKPEVDGDDEDDDLSMGDLESAFSDSDLGSEGGINLGGGDDDDEDAEAALDGKDEMDGDFPEFESDDEAMFDDDDDVPEGLDDESEEEGGKELSRSQKKRKERKKLKSLPTFASAEDYAKLLDADGDDDFKV
jgi:ribosome biogenesis protein MAK21